MSSRTSRLRTIARSAAGATVGTGILVTAIVVAPLGVLPSNADLRDEYTRAHAQAFVMSSAHADVAAAAAQPVTRDEFGSTPGPETYIRGGTNHDWAKLVLLYAGWPVTDSNVTVILRWMRQENGPESWYTRNNPLNIGAGGFASYSTLEESARVVAKALTTSGMYRDIAAGFASSAPTDQIEYAIWASPWAGGHYAWGGHWHYHDVPVVSAPSGAWGR
jgi:hypothetical protein